MTTPIVRMAEEGRQSSLADAFRAKARCFPTRPAVSDADRSLTYHDLDTASDRVAAALSAGGATRGDLIGLVTDRSALTAAYLLGILKAGCAYVPLDPSYPEDLQRYIADDSGIAVITGTPEAVRDSGLRHLAVADIASGSSHPPPVLANAAADPAYVIYTSGSTGRPKGCVVSHGNVLALLQHTLPLFDVDESDRWALFHSMSFDFSVWELWGALLSGGTAVCVPAAVSRSPEELLELLARERVTVLNQVPSAFRALARLHAAADGAPALALRYVVFGGESIDLGVVEGFVARLGSSAPVIVNMYGITETTVHTTIKVLSGDDLARHSGSPIGRALPHAEVSLRDEALEPVPDGQIGEMLIAGQGVTSGYLNRPELTVERFVTLASPTGPRRYYRSGDLARRDSSGEFEYLGRNDDQVKIRGFRIELGEIEVVLRDHVEVADSAVLAQQVGGRPNLVAYVVPVDPEHPAGLEARLRQYLANRLPQHMVPFRLRVVPGFPLTPSGKLDRRGLARQAAAPRPSAPEALPAGRRSTARCDYRPEPRAMISFCLAAWFRAGLSCRARGGGCSPQNAVAGHSAVLALDETDVPCKTPWETLSRRDYKNRHI